MIDFYRKYIKKVIETATNGKKTLVEVVLAEGRIIPRQGANTSTEKISLVQRGSPIVVAVNGQGREGALRLYGRNSDPLYFMAGEERTDSTERRYLPTLFFVTQKIKSNENPEAKSPELAELLQDGPVELTYKGKMLTRKGAREVIPVQVSPPLLFDFTEARPYAPETQRMISREASPFSANAYMVGEPAPRRENGRDYAVVVYYRINL